MAFAWQQQLKEVVKIVGFVVGFCFANRVLMLGWSRKRRYTRVDFGLGTAQTLNRWRRRATEAGARGQCNLQMLADARLQESRARKEAL